MNTAITNRLKRIAGQIDSLQVKIAVGSDCKETIPQFLAIKGAVNAALLAYVKDAVNDCEKNDTETLDTLLTHLIKS
jgi:DNA-binding FrmR family transcriptional regulator